MSWNKEDSISDQEWEIMKENKPTLDDIVYTPYVYEGTWPETKDQQIVVSEEYVIFVDRNGDSKRL